MRLPSLSRGVLTDCRSYQNLPTVVPVKMAGGTHITSFAQGTPTPFNPIPVPSLLNASLIQHQFSPASGAQRATSVSSSFGYSRSLSSSYQSIPPPSISLTLDKPPIPAKLQPSSSSNIGIMSDPLFIVLDFDGTITEEDTIETLTRYAAHYQAIKAGGENHDSPSGGAPTGWTGTSNSGNAPQRSVDCELKTQLEAWSEGQVRTTAGSSEVLGGPKTSQTSEPSLVLATSLLDDWTTCVIIPYVKDLVSFEAKYRPYVEDRKTWMEEEKYLEGLRTVEDYSIKRVEASPIFRGFERHDFWRFGREAVNGPTEYPLEFLPCLKPPREFQNIQAPPPGFNLPSSSNPLLGSRPPPGLTPPPALIPPPGLTPPPGRKPPPRSKPPTSKAVAQHDELTSVRLRKGFKKFHKENKEEWKFGLVSVNWSQDFIEGVLTSDVDKKDPKGTDSDSRSEIINPEGWVGILANHITPHPAIKGPPEWQGPLTTARDKAEAFSQLRARVKPTGSVVYIGDSKTDLLCLRDADLGIVITNGASKGSLISTLRRIEGPVPHISNATLKKHYVWARDFDEIIDSGLLTRLARKTG